jgi:hypothetical protein
MVENLPKLISPCIQRFGLFLGGEPGFPGGLIPGEILPGDGDQGIEHRLIGE